MATPVFVDTGTHYALADANDPDHEEAVRLLQQIGREQYGLVSSNFVISESLSEKKFLKDKALCATGKG